MPAKRRVTVDLALARIWMYYDPARKEVIERCRVTSKVWRCEHCGKLITKLHVHHNVPVPTSRQGASISEICRYRFVDALWLKGVCQKCHKELHLQIDKVKKAG